MRHIGPPLYRIGKDQDVNNLEELDKSLLILRIKQLEKHVLQLQNIIKKLNPSKNDEELAKKKFDFSKHKKRHVCLKILYLGWKYKGYVVQENITNTIEHHLFKALNKTKLIESRQTSNYHRCGRTDKGVNAYSQVISLDLRTNVKCGRDIMTWDGTPCPSPEDSCDIADNIAPEFKYCKLLNKVLPYDIRVYAWVPVPPDFSARFDCKGRLYKYIMPTKSSYPGSPALDITRARLAADKLVGHHDFRNFCRMDVANGVTNYDRTLSSVNIIAAGGEDRSKDHDFVTVELGAPSFLWHQVRCIVAILALIGAGKEDVSLLDPMFDTASVDGCGLKAKPNYNMAPDYPLILWDCSYGQLDWNYDVAELECVVANYKELWTRYSIKSQLIKMLIDDLEKKISTIQPDQPPKGGRNVLYDCFRADSFSEFLPQGTSGGNHRKLMTRPHGLTLDERLDIKRIKSKIKCS